MTSKRVCIGREGCIKKSYAKGMCKGCYERNRMYGSPDFLGRRTPPEIRFWRQVSKTDDHWLWMGALTHKGYGLFKWEPGNGGTGAHRAAWILSGLVIPEGYQIDHRCRVKHCVNPKHLEAVTGAENMDRMAKAATKCRNGHPKEGKGRCPRCITKRFERFYNQYGSRKAYNLFKKQQAPGPDPAGSP